MPNIDQKMIRIGVIGKTHGISGEVRFYPDVLGSDTITKVKKLRLKSDAVSKTFVIENTRICEDYYIIKLKEIDDLTAAEKLVKAVCTIQRADLGELTDGNYACDLVGFKLCAIEDNKFLGIVKNFWNNGSHDVLVFESPKGLECMMPYVDSIVGDIDMEGRTISVVGDIVEELIEINEDVDQAFQDDGLDAEDNDPSLLQFSRHSNSEAGNLDAYKHKKKPRFLNRKNQD